MDIGLIILIIIASIVGNIMKQNKRQREKGGKVNNPYSGQDGLPPLPQYRSRRKSIQSMDSNRYGYAPSKPADSRGGAALNPYMDVLNQDMDSDFSLEGRRTDIGSTYESQNMPSLTPERSTLEDYGLENTEITHKSYEEGAGPERGKDTLTAKNSEDFEEDNGIKLNFSEDSLISGIIMAEVIGPPKCRR